MTSTLAVLPLVHRPPTLLPPELHPPIASSARHHGRRALGSVSGTIDSPFPLSPSFPSSLPIDKYKAYSTI